MGVDPKTKAIIISIKVINSKLVQISIKWGLLQITQLLGSIPERSWFVTKANKRSKIKLVYDQFDEV